MNPCSAITPGLRRPAQAALALALGLVTSAHAFVFEFGSVKGSFDTTVSIGGLYRLNNPDPALYGLTDTFNGVPGLQKSVNADDGDLNYRKGMASILAKASHDFSLEYKDAGLFVRGYYFNDFVNSNGTRNHVALSGQANSIVSNNAELLDAYVYFKPTLGDMPASIRIGRQVLSWGESTFIPNGINSINPVDVAKLRTPGSELKEALLPVDMVSASLNATEDLSLEAFYLLGWDAVRIDPPGSYFSTNDFVAPGGTKVYLGFGAISDSATLGAIPRGPDRSPGSSGQYGVNLRYIAHGLNDTEFGLYFMNYHSRLPLISARTPSSAISSALVQSTAGSLGSTSLLPAMLGAGLGLTATDYSTLLGAALTGVPVGALPATYAPFYSSAVAVANGAKTIGFLTAAASGQYLIEYPKDIAMFGASFNTSVHGIALQGEVSYRNSQPFQIDDVELLFGALSSLNPAYGANNQVGNYLGQLSTYVSGYRRLKVTTGQLTATWVGRGILGSAQTTLLAEAGFVDADLPSQDVLRFDGPGTFVGGSLAYMTNTGNAASGSEPSSAFASNFSWGYQLVGKIDYNNVFEGVNVSPRLVFGHDVQGNTPLPMGNFIQDRKTVTVGAEFTFQNAWAFDVSYVNFFGAGRYNLLGDRDYVSCNLKFSF